MKVPEFDDAAALRAWRDHTLYRRLMRAARAEASQTLAQIHQHGYTDVSLTDTTLLANLDTGGCTITDLARRAGVTRQAASQQVAALVKTGYLQTRPSDTDGRAVTVIQTDRGRALLRTALEIVASLETGYAAAIGERRVTELQKALDLLLSHIDPDGWLGPP